MTARASRRGLLGAGASMLLLIPAAAGAEKAHELDGELLAACARFHAAHDQRESEDEAGGVTDERAEELDTAWDNALDAVSAFTSRTPEGLQARAHVAFVAMRWQVKVRVAKTWEEQAGPRERLAIEVLRAAAGIDVLRGVVGLASL